MKTQSSRKKQNVKKSDIKRSLQQVTNSMNCAGTTDQDIMLCAIDELIKKINSVQGKLETKIKKANNSV